MKLAKEYNKYEERESLVYVENPYKTIDLSKKTLDISRIKR